MGRKKRDEAHLLETIGDLKEEIQVLKAEFRKMPAQPKEGNWDELRPCNTRNPREQGRGNGRGAFQRRNNSAPSYACWACGQTGHFAYQCTNVNTKGKCFLYYKERHLAKDCPSRSVNLAFIEDARTTIKMYMVGSTTKTLLLEINWITKYKADILGSIKKLRFVYQGKPMEVDLFTQRPPAVVYHTSEDHSINEYESIFTTIFEEDYKWEDLKEESSNNIKN